MNKYRSAQSGFTLLEVIIAAALFLVFSSVTVLLCLQSLSIERQGVDYLKATSFAIEGREAVRFLRKSGYAALGTVTNGGVASDGYGGLRFDGSSNTFDHFERRITVADENEYTKRVEIVVLWPITAEHTDSVTIVDYYYDWQLSY